MHSSLWLTFLLVVPLAGALGAALTRKVEGRAYMVAIGASTIELVLSVIVAFLYNDHIAKAQTFDFATRHVLAASFGLAYDVSIDGISVLMVVLTALTVLLAVFYPSTYRSTGTILIEQQEIPQELVRSVITSFADQRVQVISQRVMTTQNLLSLIERYNLYPDIREKEPREVLLAKMKDDIGMHMISADVIDPRSGRPTQATIAFSVSYSSRSPDLALKVASELTTLYLNENLTSRTQQSQQTAAFFSEEATRLAARIAELDKSLSTFKEQHHD